MQREGAEDRNKALVQSQHEDVWNKGNLQLVDEMYASSFICHSNTSSTWHGPEGVRERVRAIRTAFPDWTETVQDTIAENDRVVTRFVCTGTHRGMFMGIEPTGRRIRGVEVAIFRIEHCKIAEQWLFADVMELRHQLTEVREEG